MENISIIPINGQSQYLNYSVLESSFKATIGKRCSEAKVFLFNDFPISVSVETTIDLILVIAIPDKKGNFYIPKSNDSKPVYFHNQIIPIKIVTHLRDELIAKEDNQIVVNDGLVDYSTEINSIRFGLINYLGDRCSFSKDELYISPLIFIQNKNELITDNYIVAESLDFNILHKYFGRSNSNIFISYKRWRNEIGYSSLLTDMKTVTDQASKDSEIGYLTKKKVDRIGKQLSNSKKIFDELNRNLIVVEGKAGTGKSSELLLLTMKCISEGKNTLYLTYNRLLIFDIAKTIKSYVNAKLNNKNAERHGEGSVLTLHAFFYRLSKSLGVLHVLKADRIESLLTVLKERMRLVYDFLIEMIDRQDLDFEKLKTQIQNNTTFDIGTKAEGIDFVNYLQRKNLTSTSEVKQISIEFFNYKKEIISNIETNAAFLADYYGVLENTLFVIQNPEKYFEKYKIQDKFELLEVALNLKKEKHTEEGDNGIKFKFESFNEKKNRSVGGYRRKRTLFIDEAQDCHQFEKEILIYIYGSDNIVVANGGKEQLIRHIELCRWDVSLMQRIDIKKYHTRSKSYRVKKTVVDFCNFIADKYQIDLNLEPLESEDEGEILFDFRMQHTENEIIDIFNYLNLKGEINGCTPYETLLVLLESNSQRTGLYGDMDGHSNMANINEYGNIEQTSNLRRGLWQHIDTLKKENIFFWDGTVGNKSQLVVPSSFESRVIYYESCRGLEAWSVTCFSLDKFFNQKREDPDAEKYLIGDLFLNQNNEQRKSMYAATWILMAMTRVIDTLYIQIEDENSEFGKLVEEYIQLGNRNVKKYL